MEEDLTQYFADASRKRREKEAMRVAGTMALHEQDPEEIARNRALATKLGVPLGLIETDPKLFQQQLQQKHYQNALKNAPKSAAWLQGYERQVLARDDMDNLVWWERQAKTFQQGEAQIIASSQQGARHLAAGLETTGLGRAIDTAQASVDELLLTNEDGTPNMAGRLANFFRRNIGEPGVSMVGEERLTPEERRDAILAQQVSGIETMARETAKALDAAGIAPMQFEQIDSLGDVASFITENLAANVTYMLAGPAAGKLGPLVSGAFIFGELNDELIEKTDLTVEERVKHGVPAAIAMTSLEMFGLSRVFGGILPGSVATEAIEGTLAKRLIANGMNNAAARTIQAGIAEGSTEILQEGIMMGVTAMSGGEYTMEEVKSRLINSFAAGTAIGAAMRGGGETLTGGGRLMRDAGRYLTGSKTRADLEAVDGAARQSKLKGRALDEFQSHLEATGYNATGVTVPAQEVFTYYNSAVDDVTLEQLGIDRSDFDAALATGGDITVPLSNYATHVADTPLAEVVKEHGRIDPDAMSAAEARAFEAGIGERIAQAIEEDMQQARDVAQAPPVRQRLTQALTRSQPQVSSGDVEVQATVIGNALEGISRKTGIPAETLLDRFGLDVRGVSDIPPDGATDTAGVSEQPAARTPIPPPTADEVFSQTGIEGVEIDVEMDDGSIETVPAIEARDALTEREENANQLLRCLLA